MIDKMRPFYKQTKINKSYRPPSASKEADGLSILKSMKVFIIIFTLEHFKPCYHEGYEKCDMKKCHNGSKCEASCTCYSSCCLLTFRGCNCLKSCQGRCCPCYSEERLCSPFLCKNCGDCCNNNKTKVFGAETFQYRLVIGTSNIHGWGLYTLDNIPDNSFIREYTGEFLTDEDEIGRRGKQNQIANTTYMFSMSEETTIDSMFMGNKTRFCNHSEIYDNVVVKILNDAGIFRICFFSKRPIKKYEELLFNYRIDIFSLCKDNNSPTNRTSTTLDSYTLDLKEPSIEYSNSHRHHKNTRYEESSSKTKYDDCDSTPSQEVDLNVFFIDLGLNS